MQPKGEANAHQCPTVEHARREQLRAAAEIERNGWDERGAVLGMGDWMAEEMILEGKV
jgi:hypothetical protein